MRRQTSCVMSRILHYVIVNSFILAVSKLLTMLRLHHICFYHSYHVMSTSYLCLPFLPCYVYIISVSTILTMLCLHHICVYYSYHVTSASYLCLRFLSCCVCVISVSILTMLRFRHIFVSHSYHVTSTSYHSHFPPILPQPPHFPPFRCPVCPISL